ncbi:glycosyltransferase sugar-binding protein containing DXD motif [Nitzschia inconspicua]|uniref:Glycosyltransferase sugar-binding protein containing DXD motif n=1 Tax=Nitzschia inconspicua TaxID=303405 RepID=A0A9K3L7C3_9STRA|nr:glycosyltransferase sugar-binding protein containing DXD motif [Nitzschia inconspicua]
MQKDSCRIGLWCMIVMVIIFVTSLQLWLLLSQAPSSLPPDKIFSSSKGSENDVSKKEKKISPTDSQYAIPRTLIFTHHKNLFGQQRNIATDLDEEETALAENVHHSIDVHDASITEILFWTDQECIESLRRVYPSLIPFFQNETEGMYKADICRGTALYENGGFYLDVDVGVRHSLWNDLRPSTEFVTARVHQKSHYPGHFFQAILGAKPKSPVLLRYLRLFEKHYKGVERVEKGPLGVILLKRAWDEISRSDKSLRSKTELYQEILFDRKLFPNLHPAPTWGTRRACHFVVVAQVNNKQNVEVKFQSTRDGEPTMFQVPVLSRIPGSRMCPDEVHGKKQTITWWNRE